MMVCQAFFLYESAESLYCVLWGAEAEHWCIWLLLICWTVNVQAAVFEDEFAVVCLQIYQGPDTDAETCTYHPGAPVFHEG